MTHFKGISTLLLSLNVPTFSSLIAAYMCLSHENDLNMLWLKTFTKIMVMINHDFAFLACLLLVTHNAFLVGIDCVV